MCPFPIELKLYFVAGLELVNPSLAAARVKAANDRWFAGGTGTFSFIGQKGGASGSGAK
jgi:hypothetical protein